MSLPDALTGGPEKNAALIFPNAGSVELQRGDAPALTAANHVLVRADYSLISPGTELAMFTGQHVGITDPKNKFAKFPFKPGYSLVGKVLGVGDAVEDLKVGDRVFALAPHARIVSRQADSDLLPVIKLAEEIDSREALFSRLAAISMTALLRSHPEVGRRAVVLGMGLVGNLAAQLLRASGCRVLGVDISPGRLEIAEKCGIRGLNSEGGGDVTSAIHEACEGEPEIVIEATGAPQLVKTALEVAAPGCEVVLLGSPRGEVTLNVYEYIHRRGISLVGAHEGMQGTGPFPSRRTVTQRMLDLLQDGSLKVGPMITHELRPEEASRAYQLLLEHKEEALGVIFRW